MLPNRGLERGYPRRPSVHRALSCANISWRLGQPASPGEIERQLGQLNVHDDVRETFERTRRHLADNNVDIETSKLTLGQLLHLEPGKESFVANARANALLTCEYRKGSRQS